MSGEIAFRMPSLGADMEAGTVIAWHVEPGDRVHRGDVVALIDTEKAEIETEIWDDGVIDRILVPPGRKVPVGTVLATLRPAGESAERPPPPVPAERAGAATPAPEPARAVAPPAARPAPAPAPRRVRASPLARRLAARRGVALETLRGSGPDGAVLAADVETAAEVPAALAPVAAPGAGPAARRERPERLDAMRRAIAGAMARSKREIPHYYLETEIDLAPALAWLEAENARRPVTERVLPAALLLGAVARALRDFPELNGHWTDGVLRPADAVHLGVAVSLRGGGLLAPAIHHADDLGPGELMAALRDLVARARGGGLRGSEMTDATATVTNLGDPGVEKVYGVIYPPQVALVGFGRVTERPFARDGMLGARPGVTATLAADHRASDGVRGARFLRRVARELEAIAEPKGTDPAGDEDRA